MGGFMKLHKWLFDEEYRELHNDAKLLYSAMLDRRSLSESRDFRDEHGEVFIFFAQKSVMKMLGVGNKKAGLLVKQLVAKGLIPTKLAKSPIP